jgi:sugar lactone lactonase YvrE
VVEGSRVLRFDAASFRDSSPDADAVYDQLDFTTTTVFKSSNRRDYQYSNENTTAIRMNSPSSVCVDASDQLWVANSGNHRVLRFDSITTKPSGAAADGVLGQPDFTTRAFGKYGTSGLTGAVALSVSSDGTLYVTCGGVNRLMRFTNAAALANNSPADAVLGFPDSVNIPEISFDGTATNLVSANGVWGSVGGFLDSTGSLWIADYKRNRVLRFAADANRPVLAVKTLRKRTTKKPFVLIQGTAADAYGISKVEYRIGTGPLELATGTKAWSFKAPLSRRAKTKLHLSLPM